ncbi:MAG: hypothetical protein HQL49_07410 [Gammaproteobacteria bacterium]|nr:hypothetical protein [Gammaproteobacteria bacterium]
MYRRKKLVTSKRFALTEFNLDTLLVWILFAMVLFTLGLVFLYVAMGQQSGEEITFIEFLQRLTLEQLEQRFLPPSPLSE